MKKLFLLPASLLLMTSLNAKNLNSEIALINMATSDLSGIDTDDTKCQNAILDFYKVVAKKGEQNVKVIKQYKDCMAKKQ